MDANIPELVRKAEDLTRSMVEWVVGVTDKVTDFNVGSVTRSLLEATAAEMEEITYRTKLLVNKAIQESVYLAFGFNRLPAQPSIGLVRFSRATPAPAPITIAKGTIVQKPKTATAAEVRFQTRQVATLAQGQTTVDVAVEAISPGTAGNVLAATVTELPSAINGITAVTNPSAFTIGRDEETESQRKRRFQLYIDSLPRATRGALEFAGIKANPTVFEALAIEDPAVVVNVETTAGNFSNFDAQARDPDDAAFGMAGTPPVVGTAVYLGSEDLFYGVNFHVETASAGVTGTWEYHNGTAWVAIPGYVDGSGAFAQNGSLAFTIPADWKPLKLFNVTRFWIRRRITAVAGGAVAGTMAYISMPPGRGYVDLVVHDGSGLLPDTMRTDVRNLIESYRACGIRCDVKAPTLVTVNVTTTLTLDPAKVYDEAATLRDAAEAVTNWLNSRRLGDDVNLAELIQILMDVNDEAITNVRLLGVWTGAGAIPGTDPVDIYVAPRQIVRAGTVTVTKLV